MGHVDFWAFLPDIAGQLRKVPAESLELYFRQNQKHHTLAYLRKDMSEADIRHVRI